MLVHTVRHVVANCRASPAMLACSRRTCSVAQRHARVVSIARGLAIPVSCSVNTPTGQDGSGHVHVRLRQRTRVGAPKQGMSTKVTVRRPWLRATTPQVGQPITAGGDSTSTTSPAGRRSTSMTCTPGRPTRRSQLSQ